MPAARKLATGSAFTLLALFVGGVAFGSQHFVSESEPAVAALAAFVLVFSLAFAGGLATLCYNYFVAPSKMWLRDQAAIEDLRGGLRPVIKLAFDEQECIQDLPEGSIDNSVSGKRWHGIDRY